MLAILTIAYNTVLLPAVRVGLVIGGWFNAKLRMRRTMARAYNVQHIAYVVDRHTTNALGRKSIWFHAASMGEFEQLSQVIAHVASHFPSAVITVSLFSVSGVARAKRHPNVSQVVLLPVDTKREMRRLVAAVRAHIFVINRYDLWPNLIGALHATGTPILLINATLSTSVAKSFARRWFAHVYRSCTEILAINKHHADALRALVGTGRPPSETVPTISVVPDTRIDGIYNQIANIATDVTALRSSTVITIVVGSSWHPDELLLAEAHRLLTSTLQSATSPSLRFIIVPHEPNSKSVASLCETFAATPWSKTTTSTHGNIVVDNVGMLLQLYSIADAAYVGGGFGDGVHSVTEPACYGIPIACGPAIARSADAIALRDSGALSVLVEASDVVDWITGTVLDSQARQASGIKAKALCATSKGSSTTVANRIVDILESRS